ncbi:hypothetical protein AWC38_SpisGene11849 [Stylophora pistillata]|uniref:Uncharacterized protein n=1 Tax=Stylophora pistillata TaxID=50429 RepID=A0A2B4S490_STYPI|nr:hypothetical protein AWC38_SpisGene11849 [Stylophora pistillata]
MGQPYAKRRTELQCCHQLKKTSKLVFTDVGAKKVNCLLLGEDVLTVEVLSGTRTGGQTDGANATFSQPTSRCTEQTIRDLEVTLSTLKHIVGSIENISPQYVSKLDMASLTILVVENLFTELRDGNDMPLVLQFAHRLSSTLREHLKRNTKCSFNYFTSSSAFYSKQLGFLAFSTIPTMFKPEKDSKVTRRQSTETQKWLEEFGQSVR